MPKRKPLTRGDLDPGVETALETPDPEEPIARPGTGDTGASWQHRRGDIELPTRAHPTPASGGEERGAANSGTGGVGGIGDQAGREVTGDLGPSSDITVDIPGVGVRSFPASMPIAQIQQQARWLMQDQQPQNPPLDAPALRRTPGEAMVRGFAQGAREASGKVLTPEVTGGLAALAAPETGGASLWGPPLVAAGTSVARDYLGGETGSTMANDAAGHALVNAVPGVVKGGSMMAGMAGRAATAIGSHIPGLKTVSALAKTLGVGSGVAQGAAEAAPAVTGAASKYADKVLPFGEKLLSPEGLAYLKNEARALAMKGKAYGDPAFDAVDQMVREIGDHLASVPAGASSLLDAAGIPTSSMAAAATAAGQKSKGAIEGLLRTVLGGASVGRETVRKPVKRAQEGQP